MVGDREFARFLRFEAALTSEDIMVLASTYRRMPVSYWTSGGCQSEGPRALRPLSPVGDRYNPFCPKLKIKSLNSKSFIALAVVPGSSRTKWGTFFGTQRNLLRLRSSSQKRHGDGMKASRKFGDLLP